MTPSVERVDASEQRAHAAHGSSGRHGWLMIACCVPMLLIVSVLVATGTVGAGFIVYAVICTLVMALMMRGMHGEPTAGAEQHTANVQPAAGRRK